MRICSVFGCDNPVWGTDKNTGKGYCFFHQWFRTDRKRKHFKPLPIRHRSVKRMKEEEEYGRVCNEIDRELKKKRKWRCFFTNQKLPEKASHHHLKGRKGSLLTDKRWIVPVHDEPHMDYHDLSVEKLSKLSWYKGFLQRLKELDEGLYQKELNKKDKS